MPNIDGVLFCDGCGAEIPGAPLISSNQIHCCQDCAEGRACHCPLVLDDGRGDDFNLSLPPLEKPGINVAG